MSPGSDENLLSRQVSGSRYFFLNPGARRSGLAFGGRERCDADYAVQRERYSYHVIEYVAEGRGVAVLDGARHELLPGSVFSYAPLMRCELRTSPGDPMLKYFLCLSGRTAPKLLASAGVPCGQLCRLLRHVELRGLFDDLIREGSHHGPRTAEICTLMFKLLVLKMARAVEHGGAADDPARESFLRCKALIDAQADRLSTLQEVAALVKLDTSSVCRLFRRYVDTSPYQYLLRRKMNMAAEFLLEQRVLVKEAAFRVGFPDPYHFSRCFKACHGVSPRELQGRAKV